MTKVIFQDLSPGIFRDFPSPGILKKKIQDFPGGVGTLIYRMLDASCHVLKGSSTHSTRHTNAHSHSEKHNICVTDIRQCCYTPWTTPTTITHAKTASRMAAPDTHIAMQTANDGAPRPVFLDCDVGTVQYNGLTRFLPVKSSRSEHHFQYAKIQNITCILGFYLTGQFF